MIGISSYWFSREKNFGDLLTPLILRNYGFFPQNCPIDESDVLVVGSILQDLKKPFRGYILGSGIIRDSKVDLSYSQVWALRGELTKSRSNVSGEVVLADPGLLLSQIYNHRPAKEFVLGVVPHYVDKHDPRIQLLANRYKSDILVIDVQREPREVFADISKCSCIISSSLHGLIVADSLGIPNLWMLLSQKVLGEGFKFHDYYSSFGKKAAPKVLSGNERLIEFMQADEPDMEKVTEKQMALDACFRNLFLAVKNNAV